MVILHHRRKVAGEVDWEVLYHTMAVDRELGYQMGSDWKPRYEIVAVVF